MPTDTQSNLGNVEHHSLPKGGGLGRGVDCYNVHFFFFISMKKELKPSPLPPLPLKRARENSYEKKNTNDQMARVIRGFAPEPLINIRTVLPNSFWKL